MHTKGLIKRFPPPLLLLCLFTETYAILRWPAACPVPCSHWLPYWQHRPLQCVQHTPTIPTTPTPRLMSAETMHQRVNPEHQHHHHHHQPWVHIVAYKNTGLCIKFQTFSQPACFHHLQKIFNFNQHNIIRLPSWAAWAALWHDGGCSDNSLWYYWRNWEKTQGEVLIQQYYNTIETLQLQATQLIF